MPRIDGIDISHHNTLTPAGFDSLPDSVRFCIHKINEGTALDKQFASRMPAISSKFEMWGGYTVLMPAAPGRSSIRRQVEIYASSIENWWRPGAFTQLDVEYWSGKYGRRVSVDEVLEAADHHERLLGRRPVVYMNPREMPVEFAAWHKRADRDPFWEAYYDATAPWKFGHPNTRNAAIWQWTSTWASPAFTSGIDANEVHDWNAVLACAGLSAAQQAPPAPVPTTPPTEKVHRMSDIIAETGTLFDKRYGVASHTDYEIDLGWANTCLVRFQVLAPTGAGHLIANGVNEAVVNFTAGQAVASDTWFGKAPNGKLRVRLEGPTPYRAGVIVTLQGRG